MGSRDARGAAARGVAERVSRSHARICTLLTRTIQNRMRREANGNAVHNCYLATEMLRVCRLLEKHGVYALALKGPALAASVYGDLTLLQYTDLDLLVRQDDFRAAFAALAGDGFRANAPLKKMGGQSPYGWEMTFVREPGLYELDLHWRLSPPYFCFTPEGEELWAHAIEVNVGPGCVSTLGPEDLMLFLCAHGAKHGWQSLSGVCDIAQAVRAYQYD